MRDAPVTRPAAMALVLAGFALAALAGWMSVRVNIERACATQDTPYLAICPAVATGGPADITALRARIAANPGDANSYVKLALADRTPAGASYAAAAAKVAPNQPSVVMLGAIAALDRQNWQAAIPPLVQLVEYRDASQAAKVLAGLVAGGQGALLAPYVTAGSQWVARVLAQMPQTQASFSIALPLIVQGLRARTLEPEAIRGYIRQLKAAGAWADAYSLWLALQGHALPILFNAGFDDSFQSDGFDWEVPAPGPASRRGAIVERRGAQERGAILDIRFSGRPIVSPMIRQYLFLGPGRWRLRGDYMSRQMHSEEGIAWVVRCTADKTEPGRSAALRDTAGAWTPFSFEFEVGPGCGLAAALQLETYVPAEAVLGARGRVAFDKFSLEKLDP